MKFILADQYCEIDLKPLTASPSKNHMDTSAGAEELRAVFQRLPTVFRDRPEKRSIFAIAGDL